ncbi:MAG: biotin/lipoyl-containing protein [Elusimicrobiota bacterium]
MVFEFKLPDLGEGLIEAEVVKWLVKEGDPVQEDQNLAEILTDKAMIELPSPKAGKIVKLHAPEGAKVKVGEILLAIEES